MASEVVQEIMDDEPARKFPLQRRALADAFGEVRDVVARKHLVERPDD